MLARERASLSPENTGETVPQGGTMRTSIIGFTRLASCVPAIFVLMTVGLACIPCAAPFTDEFVDCSPTVSAPTCIIYKLETREVTWPFEIDTDQLIGQGGKGANLDCMGNVQSTNVLALFPSGSCQQ